MGSYPGVVIRYPESDDYQEDRIVAQVLKVLDYNGARINFFENKLDSESVEYLSWDELQQLGIEWGDCTLFLALIKEQMRRAGC